MRKFFLIVFVALWFPMIVGSQDAEPTLFADDLYSWSAEVYFPQEIDFRLTALRSESTIASLTLNVSYRGTDPTPIDIDPATITETDAGGVFRYVWSIPRTNPPPLFSRIRYSWDVVTTDGLLFSITEGVDFIDQRVNWEQSNDLQGQVNFFHAANQLETDNIWRGIRATYDLLFTDASNRPTLTMLIYPDDVSIGCDVNEDEEPIVHVRRADGPEDIPCDLSLANLIYEESEFIVLTEAKANALQQIILDLLVRYYYENQWGSVDVPDWFLYGLQQFYDPRPKLAALRTGQQAARSNDLLSFAALNQPPDDSNQSIWQAQSTGMIIYLADTIGVQELYDFADSMGNYETFDEAYEDAVGEPLELLIVSWQDWLFRASTEQDYEYNPYLPDTPTPTATNTPTNTPTVTFTPSLTPDITMTPRPSVTPIPPTPTITPLPAQSFSVQPTAAPPPTPIPEEPELQFVADDALLIRAAIGGAVILGLLVLLYFVLRKREPVTEDV